MTTNETALRDALAWALPLAEWAIDDHRLERLRCGHSDIHGTYKNGVTWAGIYQSEVDQIERAALFAAMEPSPSMIDRFVSRALCVSIHGDGGWSNYAREQWQTMLAAALDEGEG